MTKQAANLKNDSRNQGSGDLPRIHRPCLPLHILWLLCTFLAFLAFPAMAQQNEGLQKSGLQDSAGADFIARMKRIGEENVARSESEFRTDKIAVRQNEILEEIRNTSLRARDFLKKGADTLGTGMELQEISSWYGLAIDGVFVHQGRAQTHRNLETTDKILTGLIQMVNERKKVMDEFQRALIVLRYQLDSLASDSVLKIFPADSGMMAKYLRKIFLTQLDIRPVDSSLNLAISRVQDIQLRINYLNSKLGSDLEEVKNIRQRLSLQSFRREYANLWESPGTARSFDEIFRFSARKGRLAILFYLQENLLRLLIMALAFIAAASFLRSLKKTYIQRKMLRPDFSGQLVLRYPALSAVMISVGLLQFIFPDPPYLFNAISCLVSALCLTVIFRHFITRYWMNLWLIMVTLFLAASALNFLLMATRTERWFMLFTSLAGVATGAYFVLNDHRRELKEKWIVHFISIAVALEFGSVLANLSGRYNLAKTLLVSGYLNVVIGILFLWTVRLINEALALGSNVYLHQERKFFYINFERLGSKVPRIFYVFLLAGWFILIARNFYIFRFMSAPLQEFLVKERTLGSYSFSVRNLIVFVAIMAAATIISRIVSYFASDGDPRKAANPYDVKPGLGSWVLLVRISIISLGLFLAFAAAGIPMDKIAIILGALGVGIGFGLQSLVNNLVSGLIIAFEKPVNVGDVVEIAGQSGTMKAIGFRSSIISTWDGAEVVMPNGELLNSQLVNWTLSDIKRRIEVVVGVAYGTDLDLAKKILEEVLHSNRHVVRTPEPLVLFKDFGNSSIETRVLFWVQHFKDGPGVKSDIIRSIDESFRRNGITIPFPQQDIHLHRESTEEIKHT